MRLFDIKLIQYALELKKPILGICRGSQILNVYFGGSLYQDISLKENTYIKHNQERRIHLPTHHITVEKDSWLGEILGEECLINSFHHLAMKEMGKGLKVVARSKDDVVEAFESEGGSFILGVQWHPEMMSKEYPGMQKNI